MYAGMLVILYQICVAPSNDADDMTYDNSEIMTFDNNEKMTYGD